MNLIYILKSNETVSDTNININNTTDCHPIKDNFDFWCKKRFDPYLIF